MSEGTKPVSFTLGEHDREFIAEMVTRGRFGNRTEVVRAGLRLLEDYESNQKIQRLKALIAEGDNDIDNGRLTKFAKPDELVQDVLNLHRSKVR